MDKLFVIVCSNVFSLHANLITLDKGLTVTYSFLFLWSDCVMNIFQMTIYRC